MALDAIIIADSGSDSFSGTSPLKLNLDGRIGDVQAVLNYLENAGRINLPIAGDRRMSWASAPKLNGIYLWNYLHWHGFEVAVIDSFYEQQEELRRLLKLGPHTVILSTTFINNKKTLKKMLDALRDLAPDVAVVAGGSFVFMSYFLFQKSKDPAYPVEHVGPDFLFFEEDRDLTVDLFITGSHGEDILCRALEHIKNGRETRDLPNTAWITDEGYRFGPQIDDSQMTDHPIDWRSLPEQFFSSGVVPLQSSNGCPYNCAFCTFVKNNRRPSVKPLEELIGEMKQVRSRGIRYIWFVDDNFRLGKGDLEEVCRRMIEEDMGLRWMTFMRAGTLDQMDINLLRRAGCIEVQLGLESADAQVLRNMNKKAAPELYDRVLNKVLSAGIACSCYLIFGFPGETDESAMRTIDFMRRHDAGEYEGSLSWSMFPFVLAPLSPIYEAAARACYQMSGYMKQWQHATMDSKRALGYVLKAFSAMEKSSVIYRGDNQDLLHRLTPAQRRRFQSTRHALSKAAINGTLEPGLILESFQKALAQ
ncbi:MAG: radical SAM protein [Desulfobacteraceae bacterium]|nr:MAG: radical SAM protein [Desulfobacteraceae bacterium]